MGVGGASRSFNKNMTKVDVFQSQSLSIVTMVRKMVINNEDVKALIKIKMEVGFSLKKAN